MESYLQLQFDEVAQHLNGVRDVALRFTAALDEAQPRHKLAYFGTAAFFVQALEEGYSKLRDMFLRDRTRGGVVPIIDDFEIRKAFLSALDVRSMEDVVKADVPGQVAQTLSRLAELIPEAAAQDTINAQLASRAFSTLNLERQEFVQKAGKVVLASRACIDSIDKKYSNQNNYHYSCRENVRNQAAVMSELVKQYNFDRDKSIPTWVPSWNEIDDATRNLSRSPNVLHLLGAELRFKVSTFEWHLAPDFAAFLSEFISLHLRR
ncbi:hypothetical protein ACQHIH_21735 (plasmid) [Xanthomonas sontii]|uniref:hypothetical protein n=1 Tax=Xanthomonas sontii TaxID=2650745 RepID=UPI003F87F19A